jgi:hypothetical protein
MGNFPWQTARFGGYLWKKLSLMILPANVAKKVGASEVFRQKAPDRKVIGDRCRSDEGPQPVQL